MNKKYILNLLKHCFYHILKLKLKKRNDYINIFKIPELYNLRHKKLQEHEPSSSPPIG